MRDLGLCNETGIGEIKAIVFVKQEPKRRNGERNQILKVFFRQSLTAKLLEAAQKSGHIIIQKP